jgi:hypothetical protein
MAAFVSSCVMWIIREHIICPSSPNSTKYCKLHYVAKGNEGSKTSKETYVPKVEKCAGRSKIRNWREGSSAKLEYYLNYKIFRRDMRF